MSKKQIIIDYEEYLELKEVYDIFKNIKENSNNISYNYPPSIDKVTEYIENTQLLKLLDAKRYSGEIQEIVIRKG